MSLEETLAKALAKPPTDVYWDTAHNEWKEMWRERARAALEALNIPPEAGKVDVGEAVESLGHWCRTCAVNDACKHCGIGRALRALGVKVVE